MTSSWLEWLVRDGWLDTRRAELAERCLEAASDPSERASLLVQEGLITPFQAKNLIAGSAHRLDCGRYRIRKRLGKGGMGEVFAAEPRDRRDIPVAVKVLQIDESMPDADRKRLESRFLREMKAGRDVKHPNVTSTVDFGRDADRLFLVMPRLRGPSLAALIEAKNRKPELKTVVRMAAQVAAGLEAIHEAGLIHRDLKPSNILYDGHKHWKILDLGLAKALGDRLSLTRPGVILGTLDYAAPEQLKDASKVDPAADYYALGCILYHALAGHVPFEGGDAVSKIYRHRMTQAEPMLNLRPDLPKVLGEMVDRLLAKDPSARPAGKTVLFVLEELLQGRAPKVDFAALTNPGQVVEPASDIAIIQELQTPSTETKAIDSARDDLSVDAGSIDSDMLSDLSYAFGEISLEDDSMSDMSIETYRSRSRYVANAEPVRSPIVRRSKDLEMALRILLSLLLTASVVFFLFSLQAFWVHFRS